MKFLARVWNYFTRRNVYLEAQLMVEDFLISVTLESKTGYIHITETQDFCGNQVEDILTEDRLSTVVDLSQDYLLGHGHRVDTSGKATIITYVQ